MKFKEGDKVRLREDLIVNKEYLGIRLLRGMIFLGAKPIEFVYDNIRVDINGFIYTVDMLELVESTKKEVIPVLDDVEKKYLENTLKPYKVINVVKYNCSGGFQFIYAWIMDVNNDCKKISFPYFKKDTKYKGMEPDKLYTLKELGIFVEEEKA